MTWPRITYFYTRMSNGVKSPGCAGNIIIEADNALGSNYRSLRILSYSWLFVLAYVIDNPIQRFPLG